LFDDKEMLEKIISNVINERIDKIFGGLTGIFKKKYNEYKIKTGKAFEEYIKLSIEKYKYTKTILYKYDPVLIEDFYVDLDLELNNKIIDTRSVKNLIEINNGLIITGIAGGGKSTLMKYLFLDSIKNEIGIPIFIEIRNIKKDIFSDLFEILKKSNFPQDVGLFKKILKNGKFIIFLDGIDEVSPEIRDKINSEILDMRESFSKNVYIVTSRPYDNFISWSHFTELKLSPLTKEKAKLLIKKINYENSIKDKFLSDFDIIFRNHESFATNPLLLTLMLMTYVEYSAIPAKVSLLYEQIFEMLYSRHDATKFGYSRKIFSNLSQNEFKKVFSCFSLNSYLDEKIRFTNEEIKGYLSRAKEILNIEFNEDEYLKDLLQSVCLIIQEGFYYTFTHRTFQEYFTSFFIVNTEIEIRKKLLEIVFKRVSADRTLDLIFEMNRDIFENEFLIPKLHKIKEDTKYEKLNNNEESFRIFVENGGFDYSIITYPQTLTHFHNPYKKNGLLELVNRIYPKIYPKSNDITKYYMYYREKYLISNVNYYRNYLKEREKKGIVLYNSNIIKKEQLLLTRDLKAKNLDDFLIFSITELKKVIKLYNFCLAVMDHAYSEYLYLMYLMEKITSTQSRKKKIF
jgi:SpoVK/Ycf46/Vps4 family AAA+-type ATPase